MSNDAIARQLLAQEARALLTRIDRLAPFALQMPMVTAAAVSPAAQTGVESLLLRGRRELTSVVTAFLRWLEGPERVPGPTEAQRRFNVLKLRFNLVIRQFDLFANIFVQRSQHDTGVWIAGLDDVAADALSLPGDYFDAPPLICYLDGNHGAAIRRAHTRLPGGDRNPVAVISVPRERMVGSGVASSLVHEVGHQGIALLKLLPSLRESLRSRQAHDRANASSWAWFERWISEIAADFWSVARLGIGSTLGLMSVVSLPRPFVFRLDAYDPHPIPWLRVKLSCALGDRLYPDPQWRRLAQVWQALYPTSGIDPIILGVIQRCERLLAPFAALLAEHRPASLRGRSLEEILSSEAIRPARLRERYDTWRTRTDLVRLAAPCQVFAVIGQARGDGRLTPEGEARVLSRLLSYWAVKSSLEASARCAPLPKLRGVSAYAALI